MNTLVRNLLAAALIGLAVPASAQSIDSKLEQLGTMSYVKVTGLKQAIRDGLMVVQAELFNSDGDNQTFYWRVRWLDDAGFQVWDDEPWKQELIYSNQRRVLQIAAPSRRATDFRIQLQSPKNDGAAWSGQPPI